jgi:putative ABC transport system permease protein
MAMKLHDQFRTGWRNLSRQKLRSSLTIFAIVIGAVSVTVMLSLVTSAKSFLTGSFQKTGEDRRVIVTPTPGLDYRESMWNNWSDGSGVKLTDDVVTKLAAIPGVRHVTPMLGWGYFDTIASGTYVVTMKNTNVSAYEPNGTITRDVVKGRQLQPGDDGSNVVISTDLANSLGFRTTLDSAVGATLTLTPRKDMGPKVVSAPVDVTVVGVINAEGAAIEATLATAKKFVPTFDRCDGGGPNTQPTCTKESDLQRNGYGSIYLDVDNTKDVDSVMVAAQKMGVGAAAGKDEIRNQEQAFTIIGLVLGGIGAIALFVAAIGVINTMVMATLERTREIGIMRAIGATKRTIRRLFTVEAGFLGFLGGVIGVALSFGCALLINKVLNQQLADSGVSARNVIAIPLGLAGVVIAVTTGIGMLAGRLPARRAANLDPVEALRHE